MKRLAAAWVKGLKRRGLRKVAPLAAMLDDPPEWTDDDAEALALFLGTPSGRKLRERLWDGAITAAMSALGLGAFERGEARGLERSVRLLEEHAVKQEKPPED